MHDRTTRRAVLAALGAGTLAGCLDANGDDVNGDEPTPTDTSTSDHPEYDHPEPSDDPDWRPAEGSPLDADVEVEVLVENLEVPWDIAFGGDDLFITERTGRVLRLDNGEVAAVAEPADAIDAGAVHPDDEDTSPWWVAGGEGGTMGVATHPEYPDPSYVYVYYTAEADDEIVNRLARYDVSADDPADTREVLLDDVPAHNIHNGGRIAFGPDDNLWVLTGDASEEDSDDITNPRDPASLAGKVLRLTPDGHPAPDNPDFGDDADPRVFTIGHRNPQGIDWLPSGVPVITEHGPQARDEVSVLTPGGDYGWVDARGGPDDDSYGNYAESDFVSPLVNTGPGTTWAPSGATFYTGNAVPEWENRFLVGGLISQTIFVVTIAPNAADEPTADEGERYDEEWMDDAYQVTAHQVLDGELGRVRHVAQSPDGDLYAITSNRDGRAAGDFPTDRDDVLVRITST